SIRLDLRHQPDPPALVVRQIDDGARLALDDSPYGLLELEVAVAAQRVEDVARYAAAVDTHQRQLVRSVRSWTAVHQGKRLIGSGVVLIGIRLEHDLAALIVDRKNRARGIPELGHIRLSSPLARTRTGAVHLLPVPGAPAQPRCIDTVRDLCRGLFGTSLGQISRESLRWNWSVCHSAPSIDNSATRSGHPEERRSGRDGSGHMRCGSSCGRNT